MIYFEDDKLTIRNIRICLQFSHNLHIMQMFRIKNLPPAEGQKKRTAALSDP